MNLPRIVTVGNRHSDEFREVVTWLAEQGELATFSDVSSALRFLLASPASLLVFLKSYPNEFPAVDVAQLRRAAPLLPLIVVNGNWCEADSRSGRPLSGVWRLGWNGWRGPLSTELAALLAGRSAISALPSTTTEEDRFLRLSLTHRSAACDTVAILSRDWNSADALRRACWRVNVGAVWIRHDRLPGLRQLQALIYDVPGRVEDELPELERIRHAYHVPALVTVGFPRPDEINLLVGLDLRVLSKPFLISDLAWQLDQMIARPPRALAPNP
jgi:hypothetical protein